MEKEEIPYDLIGRYLNGESTEEEKQELRQWRASDPGHEEEYQLMLATWHHSVGKNVALEKRGEEILESILGEEEKPEVKVVPFSFVMKIAAGIVVFLMIGLLAMLFVGDDAGMVQYVASQPGEQVDLPDGTSVWLSEGTEIAYAEDFAVNRSLKLVGDAYFKVAKDPDHPFVISALGTETEVLGTAFNLTAREDQRAIKLLVDEGKVAFSKEGVSELVVGGQSAVVDKQEAEIVVEKLEGVNHLFWQTGTLEFENLALETVVEDLEKYYGSEIELDEMLKEITYTGRFEQKNLGDILEIISLTLDLAVVNEKGVYLIGSQ